MFFDKLTEPILTGSKSFSGRFVFFSMIEEVDFSSIKAEIQLMVKVEELFPSKPASMEAARQLFDKMPSIVLSIVCLTRFVEYEENAKDVRSTTTSTKSTFEEVSTLIGTTIVFVAPITGNQLVDIRSDFKFDDDFWFSEIPAFIFDRGGGSWHRMGCDSTDTDGMRQGERLNDVVGSIYYVPPVVLPRLKLLGQTVTITFVGIGEDSMGGYVWQMEQDIGNLEEVEQIISNKDEIEWFASPEAKEAYVFGG